VAEPLRFEPREMIARTHRGEYTLHYIRNEDSEYRGQAFANFHGYDGAYASIEQPCIGAERKVLAACDAHAAAQPVWPPMLGWPADGELEVPRG
jgi:hypothetical protein